MNASVGKGESATTTTTTGSERGRWDHDYERSEQRCPAVLIIHHVPSGPTEELQCVKRRDGHPGKCKFRVMGSATYWAGFEPRGEGA